MRRATNAALWVLVFAIPASGAELHKVRGRVVDEAGQPAPNVDVAYYWSANGSYWDKDGKFVDFNNEKALQELFGLGRLGHMEPCAQPVAKTDADGYFSIEIPVIYHTLVAMDAGRNRGGLGTIAKADPSSTVEIRLQTLVRVRGSFEGPPGVRPDWTHIYWQVPFDPTRPLAVTRLVGCSSNDAKFVVALPPGRYVIDAYDETFGFRLSEREITLSADTRELDLGTIVLPPSRSVPVQRRESEAKGTFGDYRKYYGQKPPAWHVSAARGVKKDVQLSDFRGKWVVLEFWGLSCTPCLNRVIPELMKFHEDHAHQRDRFEILSFCLDPEGELSSLDDMDRKLRPIVEHVWGGKTMPFPILLDNTFRTWESFGLPGMGVTLLVDPQGNLVEGGLDLLEQKLKESK